MARNLIERRAEPSDRRVWRRNLRPEGAQVLAGTHEAKGARDTTTTRNLAEAQQGATRGALLPMKFNLLAGKTGAEVAAWKSPGARRSDPRRAAGDRGRIRPAEAAPLSATRRMTTMRSRLARPWTSPTPPASGRPSARPGQGGAPADRADPRGHAGRRPAPAAMD
jgi:hypothetical protein